MPRDLFWSGPGGWQDVSGSIKSSQRVLDRGQKCSFVKIFFSILLLF
jgi:hypothetical protein